MRGKIRLDKRKNSLTKKGYPVIIYLTHKGKQKVIQTGFYSEKSQWNETKNLPNKKHPNFDILIDFMELKTILIQSYIYKNVVHSFSEAEKYILKKSKDIFYDDAIDMVIENNLGNTYISSLKAFNKFSPNVTYSEIDKKKANKFRDLLLAEPFKGNMLSPNTIKRYIGCLCTLWYKLDKPNNPFSRIKIKTIKTKNKALSVDDFIKIRDYKTDQKKLFYRRTFETCQYLKLCFYLGGVDFIDIVNLTYDHIIDGRIEFTRFKGGTDEFVSNKIFPETQEILDFYKAKDSDKIIPLSKEKLHNFQRYFCENRVEIQKEIGLSKRPFSKSPRYTFINIARDLLIDSRITKEIVAHANSGTHSIYEGNYSEKVRDEAHRRIIDLAV